jgi:hypothetical protein
MQPEEYLTSVKEQLRAYDFTERDSGSDWEHPFFRRESKKLGIKVTEAVVIETIDDADVNTIKDVIEQAVDTLSHSVVEQGRFDAQRWYILLVASPVSKAMQIAVERGAGQADIPDVEAAVLPVIVDLQGEQLSYYTPSVYDKASQSHVSKMAGQVDKFFKI